MQLSTLGLRAALLATAFTGVTSAEAASWVPTATKALTIAGLNNATDLGALPDSTVMTVRVGLLVQNKAALQSAIAAASTPGSATYGQYLTPAQFTSAYAPSAAQVKQVTSYLKKFGFYDVQVEPNNLLVSATGTASGVRAAFNTSLEKISFGGTSAFINLADAAVPASLGGVVAAVLGLNSVGQLKPTIAFPGPQYLVSYTPSQFQTLYSVGSTKPASKATIAIITEGDMTGVLSDLRIAETAFGLPQVPVKVVQVGLPSPDTSGADEWDLDTQYSTGMAGTVKQLLLYDTTSLSDSDLALAVSRFATDDKAKAGSASLGECEAFPYLDGSMVVFDEQFAEAAAQGQTFFASSGDTGSFCPLGPAGVNGVPAGGPLVSYPAASPYVVGVGGTTLLSNADGSYDTEATWYAGGGGISQFEGSPYWQASKVTVLGTGNLRGVPDVAMDADPNSGADVYVNGAPEGVGGTSLASPLALGVWARVVSQNKKVGNGGSALYSLYADTTPPTYPVGGYHDIIVGANGLYSALPGYDLTTGLGTFIVDQLVAAFPKQ